MEKSQNTLVGSGSRLRRIIRTPAGREVISIRLVCHSGQRMRDPESRFFRDYATRGITD